MAHVSGFIVGVDGFCIGGSDELQLASRRPDGTLRTPTTMWVVPHKNDLYERSVNGPDDTWYRRALERREGHIRAGGVDKDVTFATPDEAMDDDIDAAYLPRKYSRYAAQTIDSITSPQARATTLRLVPRHETAPTCSLGWRVSRAGGQQPCELTTADAEPGSLREEFVSELVEAGEIGLCTDDGPPAAAHVDQLLGRELTVGA